MVGFYDDAVLFYCGAFLFFLERGTFMNRCKRIVAVLLAAALGLTLLTGCAGTPVIYYTECNCPEGAHVAAPESAPAKKPAAAVPAEGTLKTGLALIANVGDSKSATAEALGEGKYDVTIA